MKIPCWIVGHKADKRARFVFTEKIGKAPYAYMRRCLRCGEYFEVAR